MQPALTNYQTTIFELDSSEEETPPITVLATPVVGANIVLQQMRIGYWLVDDAAPPETGTETWQSLVAAKARVRVVVLDAGDNVTEVLEIIAINALQGPFNLNNFAKARKSDEINDARIGIEVSGVDIGGVVGILFWNYGS